MAGTRQKRSAYGLRSVRNSLSLLRSAIRQRDCVEAFEALMLLASRVGPRGAFNHHVTLPLSEELAKACPCKED